MTSAGIFIGLSRETPVLDQSQLMAVILPYYVLASYVKFILDLSAESIYPMMETDIKA